MSRKNKQYAVSLESEVVKRIDEIASEMGWPRSDVLRRFIKIGIEETEIILSRIHNPEFQDLEKPKVEERKIQA